MNDTMSIVARGASSSAFSSAGREHHVAVLLELVALHHVGALDRDVLLDAHVLLLDARAAVVQQVEADAGRALGGRIDLHRNRHQAEAERSAMRSSERPWSTCGRMRVAKGRRLLRNPRQLALQSGPQTRRLCWLEADDLHRLREGLPRRSSTRPTGRPSGTTGVRARWRWSTARPLFSAGSCSQDTGIDTPSPGRARAE